MLGHVHPTRRTPDVSIFFWSVVIAGFVIWGHFNRSGIDTAVLVCNKGADGTEAAGLDALDGRNAKVKMPKRVFRVGEGPRNTPGKGEKNIFRELDKGI